MVEPDSISPDEIDEEEQDRDENGLEREPEREPEIDVPFDPTKIDIIVKPMTISLLEERLKNDELYLTPEFQRQANLWKDERKGRLIESVLLRIPLPSFYFSEDTEGIYSVVDGLQRLCSIFHFKSVSELNRTTGAKLNPLRLRGLQYLKELEGKTFDELDRKFQRRISELEITANIIRANTPAAVKFNVFARLNQGGMPLNAQEIRNAIFPGEWRYHIKRMAESDNFLKATQNRVRTERQQDMELVLRFVALWQLNRPYRRPLNQTLDEFLNNTVEQELVQWSKQRWREVEITFERAIQAAKLVFGKHVFRKSSGNEHRKPINRGLFESQLIVIGNLTDSELNIVIERKIKVEELFSEALKSDKEFIQALLYATGSAEASNIRIKTLRKIIKETFNA
jgi:hypothetical protein